MVTRQLDQKQPIGALTSARRSEVLLSLVPVASCTANTQLDGFSQRLIQALMALSENCINPRQANLCFTSAQLLKKNTYSFYYLASLRLEEALRKEIMQLQCDHLPTPAASDAALTLVSYEEMDNKVLIGNIARAVAVKHADQLQALGRRLAHLFSREEFPPSQNPFRPEVFMGALNTAWAEFDPDSASHSLILPLLQPEVFLDMGPILDAINDALIAHGILPSLADAYRIQKSSDAAQANKGAESSIADEVRRRLQSGTQASGADINNGASAGGGPGNGAGVGTGPGSNGGHADGNSVGATQQDNLQGQLLRITAVSNQLIGFLAGMQKNMLTQQLRGLSGSDYSSTSVLSNIKRQAPQGALTQVDNNTIDLLTKVFDMVFQDQNIASEMKALIGFLQVPVLKAALLDQDFFFKQEHPARRLVEMLTQSSVEWNSESGQSAPLYQTAKQIVERVQQNFDRQMTVFSEVVSELDTFIKKEESASAEALQAPISQALMEEKTGHAKKVAKTEVAMRIGTGEIVAFVETFLENKWVSVLTLAYTLQDEKPQAVESAVSTMDDLIWSVKPKITKEQRKELLAKLPSILTRLNKWLNAVKWEETDRDRFFAELAETHASIVRAPLPMTPERQLELAVEVAKKAAERRLEKLAQLKPEPQPDQFDEELKNLQRGAWLNFTAETGEIKKAKLSWVSPMKSLFIFTTHKKEETFQLTDAELAQKFRDGRAQAVVLDRLVDRALNEAFAPGANDPAMAEKSAA